jgi:hypothetical protein
MPTNETRSEQTQRSESFNVRDSRGRVIGAMARLFTATYSPAPEGQSWGYRREAGSTWYAYQPGATRDGQHYGASHYPKYFPTAAERDAAVERYFRQAASRARKAR